MVRTALPRHPGEKSGRGVGSGLVVPVVVGQGVRLFPDSGPDLALDLVESRAFPKAITLQVYRPAGRPRYATD